MSVLLFDRAHQFKKGIGCIGPHKMAGVGACIKEAVERLALGIKGVDAWHVFTVVRVALGKWLIPIYVGSYHDQIFTLCNLTRVGKDHLIGWLMGRLVSHWREQNRFSGLSLTLVLALGGFFLAEHYIHVSGVITTLCAVLAFVHARRATLSQLEGKGVEVFESFWDYLNTLAGGVLFFVLGAAVGGHAFQFNWIFLLVIALLLCSRAMLVYGGVPLLNLTGAHMAAGWNHVLMLGGLRGAVSAALVLLVPAEYPYRIDLLCLVFVFTLLTQPPLLRRYLLERDLQG